MSSPVFTRNENFKETHPYGYSPPPVPSGDTMTLDNTMRKTTGVFVALLVSAAVGWFIPQFFIAFMLIAFALGLVNAFKRNPSPPLIFSFAVFEGLAIGGISSYLESIFPGIVTQAVLATLVVVGVTLALFRSGKVRATPKMTKFFIIAATAYAVFSLINVALILTGVSPDPWGLRTGVELWGIPLGVIIGIFAILLGTYSLILDFTFIQAGVNNGIPVKYGWTAAFGIVVTVVWLYIEFLRLISIMRQ